MGLQSRAARLTHWNIYRMIMCQGIEVHIYLNACTVDSKRAKVIFQLYLALLSWIHRIININSMYMNLNIVNIFCNLFLLLTARNIFRSSGRIKKSTHRITFTPRCGSICLTNIMQSEIIIGWEVRAFQHNAGILLQPSLSDKNNHFSTMLQKILRLTTLATNVLKFTYKSWSSRYVIEPINLSTWSNLITFNMRSRFFFKCLLM